MWILPTARLLQVAGLLADQLAEGSRKIRMDAGMLFADTSDVSSDSGLEDVI